MNIDLKVCRDSTHKRGMAVQECVSKIGDWDNGQTCAGDDVYSVHTAVIINLARSEYLINW